MQQVKKFNLLLSCPGDAYELCYPKVQAAIEAVNADPQLNNEITISLKHWKKSSFPQSGGCPQNLLNSQLVEQADIAIAIFWTRFGTPTDNYQSGTEEEIELLTSSNKQVFLYFLDKPVPPSQTSSPDYIKERKKIDAYKATYNGVYRDVSDENELQEKIVCDLKLYFNNNKVSHGPLRKLWYHKGTGKAISPAELLQCGNTTAQFEGNIVRAQVCSSDGNCVYGEIDTAVNAISNITTDGYPQDYKLDIPQNLIIHEDDDLITVHGALYRVKRFSLKFNGSVTALYDPHHSILQDISAKAPVGMDVFIDINNKVITLVSKSDILPPQTPN